MQLKNSKTFENLAKAYAGECMARTRYEYMAYGADQQGLTQLAKRLKDVAYQEFNHSRMFYSFIQTADKKPIDNIDICSGYPFKEKWELLDNLKFAQEDEENEAERIYPQYAKVAREEGFDDIAGLFENVIQVENCHKMLFEDLYNQLKTNTLYSKPQPVKWKCAGCGYEETAKKAWDICPLCQAKQGAVMLKLNDNE